MTKKYTYIHTYARKTKPSFISSQVKKEHSHLKSQQAPTTKPVNAQVRINKKLTHKPLLLSAEVSPEVTSLTTTSFVQSNYDLVSLSLERQEQAPFIRSISLYLGLSE